MRLPSRFESLVLLLMLLGACGGDDGSGGDVGADGTTSSTAETGTQSSSTDVSTGSEETGSGEASGSSDAETGTVGTGTDDTGGQNEVVYGAVRHPDEDRITIYKADLDAGLCTRMRLESPASPAPPLETVTTPDYWNIYSAEISQDAIACADLAVPVDYIEPTSGAGIVSWDEDGPGACPVDLDVDVVLDFEPVEPWVPATDELIATILVEGCP